MVADASGAGRSQSVSGFDLADKAGLALLRRFDAGWQDMNDEVKAASLDAASFVLPSLMPRPGIKVAPGGRVFLVASRGNVYVPDPASATVLQAAPTEILHGLTHDAVTLGHLRGGITHLASAEGPLPVQACTVFKTPLPNSMTTFLSIRSPFLVRWLGDDAAVAWPLVRAPRAVAVAFAVAATEVPEPGQSMPAGWAATSVVEVADTIEAGLVELLNEALAPHVSDHLRYAIVRRAIENGDEPVQIALAKLLLAFPQVFAEPTTEVPGAEALGAWPDLQPVLSSDLGGALLVGAEGEMLPRMPALRIRKALGDIANQALLTGLSDVAPVSLGTLAADRIGRDGRDGLAVLLQGSLTPAELSDLGSRVAAEVDCPTMVFSRKWGLAHKFGLGGEDEGGNVGWFGGGMSVSEIDESSVTF